MSGPDRSWTIAPTLVWFAVLLHAGLVALDGGVDAVADRLTARRDAGGARAASPSFAPAPVRVADADDDDDAAATAPAGRGGAAASDGALEDTCLEGSPQACKRWAMDAYYRAVAAEAGGKLRRAVRVSWYGDSVVATDALPARLRARLQAELGDGGPGFVYVVPPHRFCHHEGVRRAQTGTWTSHAISTQPIGDHLYGAGGATVETSGGRATIKLVDGSVTEVALHYLTQPRGGRVTITAGGAEVLAVETHGDAKLAALATGRVPTGAKAVTLEAKGRARLFGVGLENASGVVVDNLGIVSVNAKNFQNHDAADFARALDHRDADLIMVMIGANEAQWLRPGDHATKRYQANFEKALAPIRRARPGTSCLVVSPTDQAEATDDGYVSRAVMPHLIEAQRQAARASGCAFFSTYDWMGGKGSAATWFRRGLVGTDFQHLSRKGANKLGDAVFASLHAGYQRYARR